MMMDDGGGGGISDNGGGGGGGGDGGDGDEYFVFLCVNCVIVVCVRGPGEEEMRARRSREKTNQCPSHF